MNGMERKRTRPPTHPGEILKYHYVAPLSVPIDKLAKHLGVSGKTLSRILNCKSSISTEMALRLSRAFETSPDLWINLQKDYDLWFIEKENYGIRNIHPFCTQQAESSFLPEDH
jgi:addiction module HigA family antidote